MESQPTGATGAVFGDQTCGEPYHGWDEVAAEFVSELMDGQVWRVRGTEDPRTATSKSRDRLAKMCGDPAEHGASEVSGVQFLLRAGYPRGENSEGHRHAVLAFRPAEVVRVGAAILDDDLVGLDYTAGEEPSWFWRGPRQCFLDNEPFRVSVRDSG